MNFFVESVDGQIVVTCFDNFVMPLIRYAIGGLGHVVESRGRRGLSALEGRTSHVFRTPDGKKFSPAFFSYAVSGRHGEHVEQFQIVYGQGKVTVRILPRSSFHDVVKAKMHHYLAAHLSGTIVDIVLVERLEATTAAGKAKLIVVE